MLKEELVTCEELLGFDKGVDTGVVNSEEGSIVFSGEFKAVGIAATKDKIDDFANTQI